MTQARLMEMIGMQLWPPLIAVRGEVLSGCFGGCESRRRSFLISCRLIKLDGVFAVTQPHENRLMD